MNEHLLEKHSSAYLSCLNSNEALLIVSKYFDYFLCTKQRPTKYLADLQLCSLPKKIIYITYWLQYIFNNNKKTFCETCTILNN